ncbi:MAG: hypothetical protein QXM17_00480 [Metallosphaera sp.]
MFSTGTTPNAPFDTPSNISDIEDLLTSVSFTGPSNVFSTGTTPNAPFDTPSNISDIEDLLVYASFTFKAASCEKLPSGPR